MTASVVLKLEKTSLSETAIKRHKDSLFKLEYIAIIPKTAERRLKSKKAQPTAAPKNSPPLKNPWHSLREAKEKAALAGDDFQICTFVAPLYDEARTYFQGKC